MNHLSPHYQENIRFAKFNNSDEEVENFKKFISKYPTGISVNHFNCYLELKDLLDMIANEKKELTSEIVINFYNKYWNNDDEKLYIHLTKMQKGELERVSSKSQRLGEGILAVLPQIRKGLEDYLSPTVDFYTTTQQWGTNFLGDEFENEREPKYGGIFGTLRFILYKNIEMIEKFLYVYRNFITAGYLFEISKKFYTEPETIITNSFDILFLKKRYLLFLEKWITTCFRWDFANNEYLYHKVYNFIDEFIEEGKSELLYSLTSLMIYFTKEDQGKPNTGLIFQENNHICLSPWTPEQIAAHLTIIDSEMFAKVNIVELRDKRWQHKNKNELAVNLVAMASRFNEVSFWVASQIVDAKKRDIHGSIVIKLFIKVIECLFNLNNFNGLMSVMSGLNNSSVQRLKDYWSCISENNMKIFNRFEVMMDNVENFKSYREHLKTLKHKPCIPYLAIHLRDVFFAIDSNEPYVSSIKEDQDKNLKFVNFEGLKITGESYIKFLLFQKDEYKLESDNAIYTYFTQLQYLDEDDLYKKSLECKPLTTSHSVDDLQSMKTPEKDPKRSSQKQLVIVSNPLLALRTPKKSLNDSFDPLDNTEAREELVNPPNTHRVYSNSDTFGEILPPIVSSTPPFERTNLSEEKIKIKSTVESFFRKKVSEDKDKEKKEKEKKNTPTTPGSDSKRDKWRKSLKTSISKSLSQANLFKLDSTITELVFVFHSNNNAIKKITIAKKDLNWREFRKRVCNAYSIKNSNDLELMRFTDNDRVNNKKQFVTYIEESSDPTNIGFRINIRDDTLKRKSELIFFSPLKLSSTSLRTAKESQKSFETSKLIIRVYINNNDFKSICLPANIEFNEFLLLILSKFKIFDHLTKSKIYYKDSLVTAENLYHFLDSKDLNFDLKL
eukprot:TRINITY_DN4817_c1_g1_i1.p1 TRINITY_DN4817_c1_g1~~TRINITY_DN4817_c1_g1_i1.p1  ORF type:complete len:895 (+),score=275.82 TRINITY_DN4817_c1_g1_i1:52-2736(+)